MTRIDRTNACVLARLRRECSEGFTRHVAVADAGNHDALGARGLGEASISTPSMFSVAMITSTRGSTVLSFGRKNSVLSVFFSVSFLGYHSISP